MLPVESCYTGVTFCCGRRIAKRTEETTGASHNRYFQDRDKPAQVLMDFFYKGCYNVKKLPPFTGGIRIYVKSITF